jgi:hypothetical protein
MKMYGKKRKGKNQKPVKKRKRLYIQRKCLAVKKENAG